MITAFQSDTIQNKFLSVMPVNYKNYPPLWFDVIRPAILKRAKHCCEQCGVGNYSTYHYERGVRHFHQDIQDAEWFRTLGHKVKKVVLTISHECHNSMCENESHMKARCQKCHLSFDKVRHLQTRKQNETRPKDSRALRMAEGAYSPKNFGRRNDNGCMVSPQSEIYRGENPKEGHTATG